MLVRWLGVSTRVESALRYCILINKRNVLPHTTFNHLTVDEPRDTNYQKRIWDYYGLLESALGSEYFGTSLDGYDSFINDDEDGIAKGDPNEDVYQGPPDSPEIDEIIDNSDEERAANSYDQ